MKLIQGLAAFFWIVNSGLMLHYDSKSEDVKSDWNQSTIDTQSENGSNFELINIYNDSIESTEHQCGCQFHPIYSGDLIITTSLPDLNELTTELTFENESDGNGDLKSSSSTTNEKAKLISKIVISDGKDKNNGVNIDDTIPGGTTVESDKDVEFVTATVFHVTVGSVDSRGETEDEASTNVRKDELSTKSNLPTDESVSSTVTTESEAVDVTRSVISEKPEETSTNFATDGKDSLQTNSSNPASTIAPSVDSEKSTVNQDDLMTNEPQPESTSESLTTLKPEINTGDSYGGVSTTKNPQIGPSTIIIISPDFNESTKGEEVSDSTTAVTSSPVDKETSSEPVTTTTEAQGEGEYETTVTEGSKEITAITEGKSESTPNESAETTTTKTSDVDIGTTESTTKITEISELDPSQTTTKDMSKNESVTTVVSSTQSVGSSTEGLTGGTSQESTQGPELTTVSTDSLPEETSNDSATSTQASDESSPTIPFTTTSTDLLSSSPTGPSTDPSTVPTTVQTESSEYPNTNSENPSTGLTSESATSLVTESSSEPISETSSGPPESSSLSPTSTQNSGGSSSESSEPATTQLITESSPIPTNPETSNSEFTDGTTIVPSTEIEEITTTSSMTTISSSSQPTFITETTSAINTSESVTVSGVTMNPTTIIPPTRITPNVTDIPKPSAKPPINQCIQFPSLKSWRYDLLRRVAQAFYLIVKRRLNLPPESPLRKSAIFSRSIRYLRRMNWSLTRTPLWAIYNARTQIIRMVKCEQSFNMFGSKVLVGIWKARLCCFNRLLIQCGTTMN